MDSTHDLLHGKDPTPVDPSRETECSSRFHAAPSARRRCRQRLKLTEKLTNAHRLVQLTLATCRFSCPMARVAYVLGALALLGGAAVAFLVAGLVNWLACENEGTPACTGRIFLRTIHPRHDRLGLHLTVIAALGKKRIAALARESVCRSTSLGPF